jgi:hypothetical protein
VKSETPRDRADRVGYAWRDRTSQSGQYIDSEFTRVEVEDLRKQRRMEYVTTDFDDSQQPKSECELDSSSHRHTLLDPPYKSIS